MSNQDLWSAAYAGQAKKCRQLVEAGANVEYIGAYGATPLSIACEEGSLETVKELLSLHANPNAERYTTGSKPIHIACQHGHIEIVKELLKVSAVDINCKKTNGQTPVHVAATNGRTKVVKLLIESGARTDIPNNDGETPVMAAEKIDNREISKLLGSSGTSTTSRKRAHTKRSKSMSALFVGGLDLAGMEDEEYEAADGDGQRRSTLDGEEHWNKRKSRVGMILTQFLKNRPRKEELVASGVLQLMGGHHSEDFTSSTTSSAAKSKTCGSCTKPFGFLSTKNICGNCGYPMCSKCTKKLPNSKAGRKAIVVCETCFMSF